MARWTRLTQAQIARIKTQYANGITATALSKAFHVSWDTIHKIVEDRPVANTHPPCPIYGIDYGRGDKHDTSSTVGIGK